MGDNMSNNDGGKFVETRNGVLKVPAVFNSKIVGLTFNDPTKSDQFESGDEKYEYLKERIQMGEKLTLVPKTAKWINRLTNEMEEDRMAIAVYHNEKQIGWIQQSKSRLAAKLFELIERKFNVSCKVAEITGGSGKKKNIGINIELEITE